MRSIVGTWRLVATRATNDAGEPFDPPYGPIPLGTVTFTEAGRMHAVLCDGRPELPAGEVREYNSYCGVYTFDGKMLVTKVDAASEPSRFADQVRRVEFNGDRMSLFPPPRPLQGTHQHREMIWERLG
jgi:hypothetical protein